MSSSSLASSVVGAVPVRVSPAARLYSDALYSIFNMLPFHELLSSFGTCRAWRDALVRQPCRHVVLSWPLRAMFVFRRSPLRHHASTYVGAGSVQDLAWLSTLPSLTAIRCELDAESFLSLVGRSSGGGIPRDAAISSVFPQGWPRKLRLLEIAFTEVSLALNQYRREMPDILQALVDCASRYASISELKIRLPNRAVTLQPLRQLDSLTHLEIKECELALKDVQVLRDMSSLVHLEFNGGEVSVSQLRALCEGHPQDRRQLQYLRLDDTTLTQEHMDCLVQLPALTKLDAVAVPMACLPNLQRMRNLRVLKLFVTNQIQSGLLIPHLCPCAATLTDLQLLSCSMSQVELTQLVTGLPGLVRLCFQRVSFTDAVPGLSRLRDLPSLERLAIYNCPGVTLVHLIDDGLSSLRSLRHLAATLDKAELAVGRKLFQVPSRIMPHLKSSCISLEPEE